MSSLSRKKIPEKHDLVIGVVSKILKHGVYISLKEFEDVVGYCHISEVAGAWIRNIRNFVRIDQNVVAKVLRVSDAGQVDLSLKRVSEQLKKEKVQEYKRQNSAIAMMKLISEKWGKSIQEVREIVEDPLTEAYGSMYYAFEELVAIGTEVLSTYDFPEDLVEIMFEVAETSIQINTISITSTLGIRSFASDGVEQVKSLLKAAEDAAKVFPDVQSEITTIGAPVYRVHLEGLSFPEVDEAYQSIEKALKDKGQMLEVEYKLEKDKKQSD
ncbi:MAG: S1 RNA-binding domain-containing protein [Candidatus Kariarchaeaceae archaeon]|jgi:translation initiation factor 2 subunit 1